MVIVFMFFGIFMFGRLFFGLFLFRLGLEFLLVFGLLGNRFGRVNKSLFDVLLGDEPRHLDSISKRIIKRG